MAYDEGQAQTLRDDLADLDDVVERRMFGGLAFLHRGHMVCGAMQAGAMFRVGKDAVDAALGIEGTTPIVMGGRTMGGMVRADPAAMADDARRGQLMALARSFVAGLPPK
ncbi:hypothetical protein DXV76_11365 [Rhodobacteraceae bacterium CCMM004]|nr:hypothetical protein DXV76_11365 [Rhodobacteraceae bacterium CCMM004]